jgi:hypothetical protein
MTVTLRKLGIKEQGKISICLIYAAKGDTSKNTFILFKHMYVCLVPAFTFYSYVNFRILDINVLSYNFRVLTLHSNKYVVPAVTQGGVFNWDR